MYFFKITDKVLGFTIFTNAICKFCSLDFIFSTKDFRRFEGDGFALSLDTCFEEEIFEPSGFLPPCEVEQEYSEQFFFPPDEAAALSYIIFDANIKYFTKNSNNLLKQHF